MDKLQATLRRIDGRGYKAYKSLRGSYAFPDFELAIDHVQGDPFAAPSACTLRIAMPVAGFSHELFATPSRRVAFEDALNRAFHREAQQRSRNRGSGGSGAIRIQRPSQHVLRRSSVEVGDEQITVRFYVGLPARGRRVLSGQAREMLCEDVPAIADRSLRSQSLDHQALLDHVTTAEDADSIRQQLADRGLVAFVADGAVLPRRSPVDDRPLADAVPFRSPPSLAATFECPNRTVSGMGLPEGTTLIVGGAYHGKSTLLEALATGVYNHVPGDGRELVVARADGVTIRAEDGRYVANVDISPFIAGLPDGTDTRHFSTLNASGSTSQAANMAEAFEAGSRLLLIDEDTSATNLMIRDRRIQELVPEDKEPITPFVDMIPSLRAQGVSTVLVAGGLGAVFDVADTVVMMDTYEPRDVTEEARRVADQFASQRLERRARPLSVQRRRPVARSIDPTVKRGKVKIRARDTNSLRFGREDIDVSRVEQIVEVGQLRAIGDLLHRLASDFADGRPLAEVLEEAESEGLLSRLPPRGHYAEPRRFELAAALNRLRSLQCEDEA
ncbi:MAG: ABC-ATPase domain-containing protein [Candidatus Brocadiia bacterium]